MAYSIIFLGATGAVGGQTLEVLKDHSEVSQITLLGRREILNLPSHCIQHMIDIFSPESYTEYVSNHDTAICTLGVGEPSKVTRAEFIVIDKTAVLDFAVRCKQAGVKHFLLLSSVGADSASRSFFLRTKGELIDEIQELGFETFSVFQPSMIITPANRYGFSQGLTLQVRPLIDTFFFGSWKKYRGIAVGDLGKTIAEQVVHGQGGIHMLDRSDFQYLLSSKTS